jgi:hypothetical protein
VGSPVVLRDPHFLVSALNWLYLLAVLLAGAATETVASRRAPRNIEQWMQLHHCDLKSVKRRWLSWQGSRWTRVYSVTAVDAIGNSRVGIARVSGGFGGVKADHIEVLWDRI